MVKQILWHEYYGDYVRMPTRNIMSTIGAFSLNKRQKLQFKKKVVAKTNNRGQQRVYMKSEVADKHYAYPDRKKKQHYAYVERKEKTNQVKTALGTRPSFVVIPGVKFALHKKLSGNSTKVPTKAIV